MSGVINMSQINDCYKQNLKCMLVKSVEDLNLMLRHKSVVSVYHNDIANMFVYYIDAADSAQ